MSERRVECPGCRTLLSVPADLASRKVRCSFCRTVFDVTQPKRTMVDDDIIAGWLKDWTPDRDSEVADAHFDPKDETHMAVAFDAAHCKLRGGVGDDLVPVPTPSGDGKAGREIRLVHLDGASAEMEFPADRLISAEFRLSIPRLCMRCNSRKRLGAHVVVFTPNLVSRDVDLAAEHGVGQLSLSPEELGQLAGEELLARLPKVPNAPFPANLPMPYFVCEKCSPMNLVRGVIVTHEQPGHGCCRLRLRNLLMAAGFYSTVGDRGGDDYARLAEAAQSGQDDPWNSLPSDAQHRIEQWFRPHMGEAMLAFVPDGDFSRSETGMAGILVTDRRLIYHRPPRHREVVKGESITATISSQGDKYRVTMRSDTLERIRMNTDRVGVNQLRKSLRIGGAKVRWA